MERAPRNGVKPLRLAVGPRDTCHRPVVKWRPACEALDSRQLLTTVATAAPEFLVPPAASVRMAAAYLVRHAPAAFAQFQTALTQAAQQSALNQADVGPLSQDEAGIVQDIESAGLPRGAAAADLHDVQDAVDFSLAGSPGIHVGQRFIPLPHVSQWLDDKLSNVPAFHQAEPSAVLAHGVPRAVLASNPGIVPIDQLVNQAIVVAREAKPTPAIESALNRCYRKLCDALGRSAITNLGPGEAQRDAIVVYYDGQVNRFIK